MDVIRYFFFILGLTICAWSADSAPPEITTSDIERSVFADDARPILSERAGRRSFGMAAPGLFGIGFVYKYNTAEARTAWVSILHRGSIDMMGNENYLKSSMVELFDVKRSRGVNLAAGIDWSFNPFASKYWRLLLGVGGGLHQSDLEVKYHRKLCTFICGYDPNPIQRETRTERFAFAQSRFGLGVQDVWVGTVKADFAMTFAAIHLRSPEVLTLRGPDGIDREVPMPGSFVLEGTFEL